MPNVKLAKRVEAAGVDAMVIEGMEGGGHIGQQTTMALMTNVLPLVKNVPVWLQAVLPTAAALQQHF